MRALNLKDLYVNEFSNRSVYHPRPLQKKKALPWGQRKLLLSEIEFFTLYWNPKEDPSPLCVYAGAAPGTHLLILSQMFPEIKFDLYDPREIKVSGENFTVYQEYFTEEIAKKYQGKNVFFISDIRTAEYEKEQEKELRKVKVKRSDINMPFSLVQDPKIKQALRNAEKTVEKYIWDDMLMQQRWVEIMNPKEALLKFRLPWPLEGRDFNVMYLAGTVFWQIWAQQASTETRLVPKKKNNKYYQDSWSVKEYEELCFYHNNTTRETKRFLDPLTMKDQDIDPPELLDDFDSCAEILVLQKYLEKIENPKTDVLELSTFITWGLNKFGEIEITLNKRRKEERFPDEQE